MLLRNRTTCFLLASTLLLVSCRDAQEPDVVQDVEGTVDNIVEDMPKPGEHAHDDSRASGFAALNYGTMYMDPDLAKPGDPTTLTGVSYSGEGSTYSYNSNSGDYFNFNSYDFTLRFDDGDTLKIGVDRNVGSQGRARQAADLVADPIGQLPAILRREIGYVAIWDGTGRASATASLNMITTYNDSNRSSASNGYLEELFIHEVAHVSVDGWYYPNDDFRAAARRDNDYVSNYAESNPNREDIAETLVTYVATRYRSDRVDQGILNRVTAAGRNRFEFLDRQQLNFYPYRGSSGGSGGSSQVEAAELTSPSAGSTLNAGAQTFRWESAGASEYDLIVGTDGAGSDDIRSSDTTSSRRLTVNLPAGETVYVRLWSYSNDWKFNDYVFNVRGGDNSSSNNSSGGDAVSGGRAELLSPSGNMSAGRQTFSWTPVQGATSYDLIVGTSSIGSDELRASNTTSGTRVTVNNIPSSGTVYVLLWTYTDEWRYREYTFRASGGAGNVELPAPAGTTLRAGTVKFNWAAQGQAYDLIVGTNGPGSDNLRASNVVSSTEVSVSGIRASRTINVRLWIYNDGWEYRDYEFSVE